MKLLAVLSNRVATRRISFMAAYWQPTAGGYFSRIAKPRILEAVREGVSPQAAENIEKLKKPTMAERAEALLSGRGWLPEVLRDVTG